MVFLYLKGDKVTVIVQEGVVISPKRGKASAYISSEVQPELYPQPWLVLTFKHSLYMKSVFYNSAEKGT